MVGSLSVLCGQMLVVGLAGKELDAQRAALARAPASAAASSSSGGTSAPRPMRARRGARTRRPRRGAADLPPLVAVDQEGGRVMRLGPPAMQLPPMRRVGDLDDDDLVRRVAEAQARELAALGFTMSFAPVADVHTRHDNPIIGDRAFATTPERVARLGGAWAEGLARGGILSCAKHFPGHGDTTVDSHLALPRVERAEGRARAHRDRVVPRAREEPGDRLDDDRARRLPRARPRAARRRCRVQSAPICCAASSASRACCSRTTSR